MAFQIPTEYQNEPILQGLNEEQYKAVVAPGTMLVLAGAGSGKTRVLSSRIAWNLKNGIAEDQILAVTFTNKAAREMRGRINAMREKAGGVSKDLWVGTFHSICVQMLREFGLKIGVDPNFHILDKEDQSSMIKRILKDMGITKEDLNSRYETLSSIVDQITKIKSNGGLNSSAKMGFIEEIYQKYIRVCENEGALDFEDLMMKTNQALSGNVSGIRDHYSGRFKRILVDEFQDTNQEQFRWLSFLKAPDAELFAVGDDDQLIYGFRGADPESMNKFLKGVASGNIIRLEQNYRSTGNILSVANGIISENEGRIGKTLRTSQNMGEMVGDYQFSNDYQEADYVAGKIKELLDAGAKHHEIAVLYRSNYQSAILEKAMLKKGVPYIIHGGTRFFERQEVKDAVAYARLAFKPEDNGAFYRIVNVPPRGLGAKSQQPIYEAAKKTEQSYMDVAMDEAHVNGGKIAGFTTLVTELNMAMSMMSLPDFFRYILDRTGLEKYYEQDDQAENRIKNMHELVNLAERHIAEHVGTYAHARDAMAEFLANFTLEDVSTQENHQSGKKAVTLMTIHSSKGLEFDYVFLTGAEEGLLPHANSSGSDSGVEEERRLMYVAVTRAKKALLISHSESRMVYGKVEDKRPSRFLSAIPEHSSKKRFFEKPDYLKNKSNTPFKRF